MSKLTSDEYFNARVSLNDAMERFIKAAYAIDKTALGVTSDIIDCVHDTDPSLDGYISRDDL